MCTIYLVCCSSVSLWSYTLEVCLFLSYFYVLWLKYTKGKCSGKCGFLLINSVFYCRHDWDKLKSMLSFQLKQVWGGMPVCGFLVTWQWSLAVFKTLPMEVNTSLYPQPFSLQLMILIPSSCEFILKVLSEYPESKMTSEQQTASIGETYPELLKKLDDGIFLIISYYCFSLPYWDE